MLFIYYKFYECCVIQLEIQVHTIYFTSNSAIPGKVEIQAHTISFICSSAILCKVNIQAHSFEQWCTNITCNMRSGNQYIALPLGFKWISGIRRICCTLRRKFEVPKNWYSSLSLYLYKYLSYLSFPALRRKYFFLELIYFDRKTRPKSPLKKGIFSTKKNCNTVAYHTRIFCFSFFLQG